MRRQELAGRSQAFVEVTGSERPRVIREPPEEWPDALVRRAGQQRSVYFSYRMLRFIRYVMGF